MRIIQTEVFTFSELSEEAKSKAIAWGNQTFTDHFWGRESLQSIKAFCDKFGVKLTEWSYGPYSRPDFSTDATNQNFRGLKLKSIDREEFLTGYCLDTVLMHAFCDHFKESGDARRAFNTALRAGFNAASDDWASQYTDENMGDFLENNQFEFTITGQPF